MEEHIFTLRGGRGVGTRTLGRTPKKEVGKVRRGKATRGEQIETQNENPDHIPGGGKSGKKIIS